MKPVLVNNAAKGGGEVRQKVASNVSMYAISGGAISDGWLPKSLAFGRKYLFENRRMEFE